MDRPGVRQVPEGSGEQGKIEETGCEIICGAPMTLVVKGLMMMMTITNRPTNTIQMLLSCSQQQITNYVTGILHWWQWGGGMVYIYHPCDILLQ